MINEYHFDKLIIGGSLESLLYSFVSGHKILMIYSLYPLDVITTEYKRSLRLLGYTPDETILLSELFDRITFVLSLTGLLVSPNIITSHRRVDNKLTTITERNKRIHYYADEFVYFDNICDYRVTMLDWFNVRSGNNHGHSMLEDNKNRFINKIYFYKSKRLGGNAVMKDLVAVSKFNTKLSKMVDHSEGIARLKVLDMMKQAGIRGQSNGFDKQGRRQHYALKIEHTYRELRKVYKPLHSLEELITQEPEKEEQWNLTRKLFRHKQIDVLQDTLKLPNYL